MPRVYTLVCVPVVLALVSFTVIVFADVTCSAANCDYGPPTLDYISINAEEPVDVTLSQEDYATYQSVPGVLNSTALDDSLAQVTLFFRWSGDARVQLVLQAASLHPATSANTYEFNANFPVGERPGLWTLITAQLQDEAGNTQNFNVTALPSSAKGNLVVNLTNDRAFGALTPVEGSITSSIDITHGDVSAAAYFVLSNSSSTALYSATIKYECNDLGTCDSHFFNIEFLASNMVTSTPSLRFETHYTFYQGFRPGTYTLNEGVFGDATTYSSLHPSRFTADQLIAMGFPNSITITGPLDTKPPKLTSFFISPKAVNSTCADTSVTIQISISDDYRINPVLAATIYGRVTMAYGTGTTNDYVIFHATASDMISGNRTHATYSVVVPIPLGMPPSRWEPMAGNTLTVFDAAYNSVQYLPTNPIFGPSGQAEEATFTSVCGNTTPPPESPFDYAADFKTALKSEVKVTRGHTVQLKVATTGHPVPTLQWYKDGVLMKGETGSELLLKKVKKSDSGEYTCLATNPVGIARTTTHLNVTSPSSKRVSTVVLVMIIIFSAMVAFITIHYFWKSGDCFRSRHTPSAEVHDMETPGWEDMSGSGSTQYMRL